jgi:hypothetical protein
MDGREQEPDECCDDGDGHQQLDDREAAQAAGWGLNRHE